MWLICLSAFSRMLIFSILSKCTYICFKKSNNAMKFVIKICLSLPFKIPRDNLNFLGEAAWKALGKRNDSTLYYQDDNNSLLHLISSPLAIDLSFFSLRSTVSVPQYLESGLSLFYVAQ